MDNRIETLKRAIRNQSPYADFDYATKEAVYFCTEVQIITGTHEAEMVKVQFRIPFKDIYNKIGSLVPAKDLLIWTI